MGATPQIPDWLAKLGMPEYAERFAENGIDISVLSDLTDQDLKEIGVRRWDIAAKSFAPLPILRSSRRTNPAAPLRLWHSPSRARRTPPSAAKSLSCSAIWSVQRHSPPARETNQVRNSVRTNYRSRTANRRSQGRLLDPRSLRHASTARVCD
jgi:hypothetical protein